MMILFNMDPFRLNKIIKPFKMKVCTFGRVFQIRGFLFIRPNSTHFESYHYFLRGFLFITLTVRILNQITIFKRFSIYSPNSRYFESNHNFSRSFLFIYLTVRILNQIIIFQEVFYLFS